VLSNGEGARIGTDARHLRSSGRRLGGDVLELEREHVDAPRELSDAGGVVVRRDDDMIGDLAGRRVRVGRQHVKTVAETPGRHAEHPSQLPAAEHADRRARKDGCHVRASRRTDAAIDSR
jgi:hypothetical protein